MSLRQLAEALPSLRALVVPAVQGPCQHWGVAAVSGSGPALSLSCHQLGSVPALQLLCKGKATAAGGSGSKTPEGSSSSSSSSRRRDFSEAAPDSTRRGEAQMLERHLGSAGAAAEALKQDSAQERRVFSVGVYGEFGNRILQEHAVAEGAEAHWAAFLREVVGLTVQEASNTMAMVPQLLSYLPNSFAAETVRLLRQEANFSPRNLHAAVLRNPWVLDPGVASEVVLLMTFLSKELGMPQDKWSQLMRQCPMVLQRGTTAMASHSFRWLRSELGLSRREAQGVLSTNPRLLTCRVSETGWKLLDLFSAQLGLSKTQTRPIIIGAPRLLLPRGEGPAAESLAYLLHELQLPREPLIRIATTKPAVLAHAPGDYLAKVVDYLESEMDFSRKEVQLLMIKSPVFLDMKLPAKSRSALAYLQGTLGLAMPEIRRMVALYPALLRYPGTALQTTSDWLMRSLECDEPTVARIVLKSPQIFGHSLQLKMQKLVDFLTGEMGCTTDAALRLVIAQPHVFSYSVEKNLLPKVQYFRSLGISNSAIIHMCTECPQIIGASLKALQDKMEYLQNELDQDGNSTLQEFPLYLSYSLERRIKPRHRYAMQHAINGEIRLSPQALLKLSDTQFALRAGGDPQDFKRHLSDEGSR